jgi:hypothetical protein
MLESIRCCVRKRSHLRALRACARITSTAVPITICDDSHVIVQVVHARALRSSSTCSLWVLCYRERTLRFDQYRDRVLAETGEGPAGGRCVPAGPHALVGEQTVARGRVLDGEDVQEV